MTANPEAEAEGPAVGDVGTESSADVEAGSADGSHAEVAAALAGELRLLEPEVRQSAALAGELLDPKFVEVGSSGQRWERAEILAALPTFSSSRANTNGAPEVPYEVREMRGVSLAPGLVQLTFQTVHAGRLAHRTSLWRDNPGHGWQMYYHQATPVPPE